MDIPLSSDCPIQQLLQVDGDRSQKNDVLFCGPIKPAIQNVVFFGGDVQDYKTSMLAHHSNSCHAEWCLESTAAMLSLRFPSSHVWVVKASRMVAGTYSVYSNFLRWNAHEPGVIVPDHKSGQRSWHHLHKLLENAVLMMNQAHVESTSATSSDALFDAYLPLICVGFSKGCVVLNQLVYDLNDSLNKDVEVEDFVKLLTSFYWLDGGHGGRSGVWITNDDLLAALSQFEINVHVTPYQISDPTRPWIGQEHSQFVAGLKKLETRLKNVVHFADEQRSLVNHFMVLRLF